MTSSYIIGLDYGTDSARGVLIDAATGGQVESHVHRYAHGTMTRQLPDGTELRRGWALQNAADYVEAAEAILGKIGRGRNIESIGLGFTASSPLPVTSAGEPLSYTHGSEPHAYVKLWKHGAAQHQADAINAQGGTFLDNFGGKLSGEWLIAKAAQIAEDAPHIWTETGRFIESGDWMVWQLTGNEVRSLGFAAYKAQYSEMSGYPDHLVPGLASKLTAPLPVGSPAGALCAEWRKKTGISGRAIVAVAVIDSHVVLPAIGAVSDGCLTGALGTSAVFLYLSEAFKPLPAGIEGTAFDGTIRGMWCYEAGQASFGDVLAWFVRTFPRGADINESFEAYNREAAKLAPGENHLVALDWWNGNRVPLADSGLSGAMIGMTMETTAVDIYRALLESICYGARLVVELFEAGGFAINRVVLTSGLADRNPLLLQIMAGVLGRRIEVPAIANATSVGAAIHGAVAAGLVRDYAEGTQRFGARRSVFHKPRPENVMVYAELFQQYREMSENGVLRQTMHGLNRID
jgi:L-ribulokinase